MILGSGNTINMAYNLLTANNQALEKTTRALSTGLRMSTAADDASGVAIGAGISSQIAGVDRAIRNAQDGISLLQTAEGGLDQINSMLQRMRELSVQAANDTLTVQDRGYIQLEINEIKQSLDNVAHNTTFNSKRLLDGSSSAMWASDDAATKLKVTGALTRVDQFGQKKQIEGNYRIEIKAKAGQGEVQKSHIFALTVAEEYTTRSSSGGYGGATEITDEALDDLLDETAVKISLNSLSEGDSGEGWNFSGGTLTLTEDLKYSIEGTGDATTNKIAVQSGVTAAVYLKNVNIDVSSQSGACAFDLTGATADVYLRGSNTLKSGRGRAGLEVPDGATLTLTSANGDGKTSGSLSASTSSGNAAGIGGAGIPYSPNKGRAGNITICGGTINAAGARNSAGIGGADTYNIDGGDGGGNITITGGNITAKGADIGGAGIGSAYFAAYPEIGDDGTTITILGGTINAAGGSSGAGIGGAYNSDSGVIRIRKGMSGSITATGGTGAEDIGKGSGGRVTDVEYIDVDEPEPRVIPDAPDSESVVTKMRMRETTLRDISQFYNNSSVFMFNEPQTITITQGDGKSTSFTLYASDTISEAAKKINDAISDGLGQGEYTDNKLNFCTVADGTSGTSESVRYTAEAVYDSDGNFVGNVERGTLLIRSAVAGKAGTLTFSADSHDLINALGLNTIQEASDNIFTASVYDAHTGQVIASNVSAQGNVLVGVISENASIEFDAMANVKAVWDEGSKRYMLSSESQPYVTKLHIQDRSTSFQIGQNLGEDIYINIADMTSESLGLSGINVLTRENASKSITLLDSAIHKVSVQRSRLGAYQNEIEYNANSLTQTNLFMQESEARITDTDMAKEYMEFVKLQILNNTSNSMLAQSQQNAQSLMNILAQ